MPAPMLFTWGDNEERAQLTVTRRTGRSSFESQGHASDKQFHSLQASFQRVRGKVSYLLRAQETWRKCLMTAFLTNREAEEMAAVYKPL